MYNLRKSSVLPRQLLSSVPSNPAMLLTPQVEEDVATSLSLVKHAVVRTVRAALTGGLWIRDSPRVCVYHQF